jgi:DNA-binding LacI/PurR family transcriptional regulator
VRGISAVVTAAGRQLLLALSGSDERPLERYLTPQHIDGALLVSLHGDDLLPEQLRTRGLPVVLGGRPPRGYDGAYVDVDNAGGARAGVTHLLERGRRRIATITGPPDEPGLVEAGTFSELSGERAMRALLARHEDLDAVFAANDSMAVGALRVLRDTGRTVPDDVAVVGFDDSPLSRVTEPLLSTVRQPVDGMGRAMAEMLLGLIAGGDGDVRHRAVLPTELVVRGSS